MRVGDARIAFVSWLFARSKGGRVVLRHDGALCARDDLSWLGLTWDETLQSARVGAYDKAREALIQAGLLYPCHDKESENAAPVWRFRMSGARVSWRDLVRGEQSINTAWIGDPVLIGADGCFHDTLKSVVDDIDAGVSHIIRCETRMIESGVRMEIFKGLGARPPYFAHVPLMAATKRGAALSVADIRKAGIEPAALLAHLAGVGASGDLAAMASAFSLEKIGRTSTRFVFEELNRQSTAVLRALAYDGVKPRLAAIDADLGEAFWNAVRANVMRIEDAKTWAAIIEGPIVPVIADKSFANAAARVLPTGPYDGDSWNAFIEAVKAKSGATGKAMFMPLRLALTGLDHGPEMKALFALIGEERARRRLAA